MTSPPPYSGHKLRGRCVLIAMYGVSDAPEMLRAARAVRDAGQAHPVLLFHAGVEPLLQRLDNRHLAGLDLRDANGAPVKRPEPELRPSVKGAAPLKVVRRLGRSLHYRTVKLFLKAGATVLGALWPVLQIWLARRSDEAVLARVQPDLIVLPLEAVGHRSAILAWAASRADIPVVVLPYSVPVNRQEIAERWLHDPTYDASLGQNRHVAQHYPQWVADYGGKRLLRLTASEIQAHHRLGLAPAAPWKAGGLQFSAAIAVESPRMASYYLREGFDRVRLEITGTLIDDELAGGLAAADSRRERLYHELGLPAGRPMLLFAVMPDFTSRPGCELSSYNQLISFIISELKRVAGGSYNIVLCLHPSLDAADFRRFESPCLSLCEQETAKILPLAHLYLASVSATIRWAIACGIPVLNYDVYRFRYGDFDEVEGVLTFETRQEFSEILSHATSPSGHSELAARQQRCRADWGTLDGQATGRILGLLAEMIRIREGRRQNRDADVRAERPA